MMSVLFRLKGFDEEREERKEGKVNRRYLD
jgi:hypothetical protein